MTRRPEALQGEELDLTGLTKSWFNVDHESGSNNITSDIRFWLLREMRQNWPTSLRDSDGDNDVEVSRTLLEEGRAIILDVLSPASYGDGKISRAIEMVERGDDPLAIQQLLDQVEDFSLYGGSFKRAIEAAAFLVAGFRKFKPGLIHTGDPIFMAGLSFLAQEIAARRQAAQNPQG